MLLSFQRATVADVAAIAALVNSAYRGTSSRAGWTTEACLLGGQRTDVEEISGLIGKRDSFLLLGLDGGEIVGSAHLEKADAVTACLGMLVIRPARQGRGLGRRLLLEAEGAAHAAWGSTRVRMQVITLRHELIAYYERRGYCRTREIRPFPEDPRFGLPKVAGLEFEVLEKVLNTP